MGDKLFLELVTSDILLQPATSSVILHGFNRRQWLMGGALLLVAMATHG
jgi:hypothetical protein